MLPFDAPCVLQVTFQLARVLTAVNDIQQVPRRITDLLAAGGDITEAQAFFTNTRQPLEWILRQVCTCPSGWYRAFVSIRLCSAEKISWGHVLSCLYKGQC